MTNHLAQAFSPCHCDSEICALILHNKKEDKPTPSYIYIIRYYRNNHTKSPPQPANCPVMLLCKIATVPPPRPSLIPQKNIPLPITIGTAPYPICFYCLHTTAHFSALLVRATPPFRPPASLTVVSPQARLPMLHYGITHPHKPSHSL